MLFKNGADRIGSMAAPAETRSRAGSFKGELQMRGFLTVFAGMALAMAVSGSALAEEAGDPAKGKKMSHGGASRR